MGRLFNRQRTGTSWDGPAAYIDASEAALLNIVPGYYALADSGKGLRRPLVRLVAVDDAPGDEDDGTWHLEVAGKGDPISRPGRLVELEAHTEGRGSAEA